jgi:hypothetical protein
LLPPSLQGFHNMILLYLFFWGFFFVGFIFQFSQQFWQKIVWPNQFAFLLIWIEITCTYVCMYVCMYGAGIIGAILMIYDHITRTTERWIWSNRLRQARMSSFISCLVTWNSRLAGDEIYVLEWMKECILEWIWIVDYSFVLYN